jgi:hypothetical protein
MYLEALSMEHQIDFVHGLDIWLPDKKVLNVEWGSLSGTKILSFRRGAWETTLLAEAHKLSTKSTSCIGASGALIKMY